MFSKTSPKSQLLSSTDQQKLSSIGSTNLHRPREYQVNHGPFPVIAHQSVSSDYPRSTGSLRSSLRRPPSCLGLTPSALTMKKIVQLSEEQVAIALGTNRRYGNLRFKSTSNQQLSPPNQEIESPVDMSHGHDTQTATASATEMLFSLARVGSSIISSGIEIAQSLIGEVITDPPPREDTLQFNGFKITTYGNCLSLNSIDFNRRLIDRDNLGQDDMNLRPSYCFRLKINLKTNLNLKPIYEDNSLTLNVLNDENAFVNIRTPLGVNSESILWEFEDGDKIGNVRTEDVWRVLSIQIQ